MSISTNKTPADEAVIEYWKSPIHRCPEEILVDIIQFLDKRMLLPVALTCKTLNRIVSPLLYENFPVLDVENGVRSYKQLYDVVQIYLKTLSRPNAAFVRHLVLDAISEPLDRGIYDQLASCVNLCRLTLYAVASWEIRHLEKYTHAPFSSVKDLTVYAVSPSHCRQTDYYDSDDNERWYSHDVTLMGEWLSHLLQMFNSLDVFRIVVDDYLDSRGGLFSRFPKGTCFSKVKKLETNGYLYYPGESIFIHKLFPSLKSIVFTEKRVIKGGKYSFSAIPFGLSSGMQFNHTPSPYRGRFVDEHVLSRIMRAERKYSWKINIEVTHLFLRKNLARSRIAATAFQKWANSHKIKVIPVYERNMFSVFGPPYSEVFLRSACSGRTRPKCEDIDIQRFISCIVPIARSLIVDTHIRLPRLKCTCQHSDHSKARYDLFNEIVKREPHFLLQHLQNFPPTGNRWDYGLLDTMDIRCMRPLGTLRSLSSIDLDFLYASAGEQWGDFYTPTEKEREFLNAGNYGSCVNQIIWLVNCEWLKSLRLRNLCSINDADENFLHQLPRRIPAMTWEWTGEVHLSRATCERLGRPLPHLVKSGGDVSVIGTVLGPDSGRRRTNLDIRVLQDWHDEMMRLAGPHPSLVLNFNGVRAYHLDDWED